MNDLVPERVTRMIPYKPGKPIEELERELGIKNAVKLASNENPYGASPKVHEALCELATQTHIYPDGAGFELRQALSQHLDVPMNELMLGNGSNELIDLVCRTFPAEGDHIVYGKPSFVCYWLGSVSNGVSFTEAPLIDDLAWDVDALLASVRPTTKVLFVANPNNPTGAHMGRADLERLCRELPERVVLVLDEAYVEYADAEDFVSATRLRALRERLLVLRTFSKAYGLASLRIGYALGPAELIDYLNRMRAPFNANGFGQRAATVALSDTEHLAHCVSANAKGRVQMREGLEAMGHRVAPSQANFVLVNFGVPGAQVYDSLLREGLITRPMPAPLAGWLRISIGTPEQNERLLAAAQRISIGQ